MQFLNKIILATLSTLVASAAMAAPVIFTGNGVLPGQIANLTNARTAWTTAATAAGVSSLTTEGFNAALPAGLDYGAFALSFANTGAPFQVSGNDLVVTEGTGALAFSISQGSSLTITFDNAINAFGIDLTSIDFAGTTISFTDSLGNTVSNFAIPGVRAGATFLGILNAQEFSAITFNFVGGETLDIDHLQFGAVTGQVPAPGIVLLLLVGALALGASRRKQLARA